MDSYLIPIKWAIIIFPLLAALITFPYILYQYRKYGAIPTIRTLILYSFVLYLLTAYFLVILPLPKIESVLPYTTPKTQLIPFYFIFDIIKEIGESTSIIDILKNSSIYNVILNVLMFLPFGIYLRYYFQYDAKKTLLCSLLLSLFFEITQLSGLYGIYPRPYRLFDVDDLFINTLGGMIGFWITPLLTKILPSKSKIDQRAYQKGAQVNFPRRAIALLIDFIAIDIIGTVFHYSYWLVVPLYMGILPWITKGKTLGKIIVRIRITDESGHNATLSQLLVRMALFYLVFLPTPFYIIQIITHIRFLGTLTTFLLAGILVVFYVVFSLQILINMFSPKKRIWHETVSHTKNSSTIRIPNKETN